MSLAMLPSTHLVAMHQCEYGLATPSNTDKSVMAPALKPTIWLTNSSIMAGQLDEKCRGNHAHQHLTGGRCKNAAFYPIPLVRAILKGISLQAINNSKNVKEEEETRQIYAMPMPALGKGQQQEEFGPVHKSTVPKVHGGSMPVDYNEENSNVHTWTNTRGGSSHTTFDQGSY